MRVDPLPAEQGEPERECLHKRLAVSWNGRLDALRVWNREAAGVLEGQNWSYRIKDPDSAMQFDGLLSSAHNGTICVKPRDRIFMALAQSRHTSPKELAVVHEPRVEKLMKDYIIDHKLRCAYELPV